MEGMKDYSQVEFQVYQNVKSPKVLGTRNHLDLFREIQYGGPSKAKILNARKLGKSDPDFDFLKCTTPTYTPNALFKGKRRLDSLVKETGFLYLDIDGRTDIHLSHPLIYASYLSYSGTGRAVLVKVKGLNSTNIKEVYSQVADKLNLEADQMCADLSRQVVMSYDPQLYHNPTSEVFDATRISDKSEVENSPNKPLLISPLSLECDLMGSTEKKELRWNNIDEVDLQGELYVILDEAIDIIEVFIPQRIVEGTRHYTVSAILATLLYLNPWLSYTRLEKLAFQINSRCDATRYDFRYWAQNHQKNKRYY